MSQAVKQFAIRNSQFSIRNSLNPDIGHWTLRFTIWFAISVLFFVTLLFTRSRSGLIGFVLADVVLWVLLFSHHIKAKLFSPFCILHFAFFIVIFFNGTHVDFLDRFVTFRGLQTTFFPPSSMNYEPYTMDATPSGTLLETGGTESGTIRTYVWQAAITAWQSSKKTYWIGTGTETFAFAFYQFKPKGHNLTSEWDFLYNKAHNEYLNYLATTGILGLGSYLLLIGVFIFWFIKVQSSWSNVQIEKNNNFALSTINYALFAGWLSILVTNFFGFSVVIVQLLFFLYPAIIIVSIRQSVPLEHLGGAEKNSYKFSIDSLPTWIYQLINLTILLVLLVLLVLLSFRWYADRLFASGYRLSRAGRIAEAETFLQRAILLNPTEPFYFDELGNVDATLSIAALENGDATAAANLADRAVRSNRVALTISPNNVNYWKTRTKIYYTFANIDPSLTKAAIASLEQAHALSPQDPKILYNLAVLLGKDDKKTEAIDTLKRAIVAKPNYRDAYIALSIFYTEAKDKTKAKEVLQQYLSLVDPSDKEIQERLKE